MSWNRRLWGILFVSRARPGTVDRQIIGAAWERPRPAQYPGEPTRCLLFDTRKTAREWCKRKNAEFTGHADLRKWRWKVSPVRVREIVALDLPLSERAAAVRKASKERKATVKRRSPTMVWSGWGLQPVRWSAK